MAFRFFSQPSAEAFDRIIEVGETERVGRFELEGPGLVDPGKAGADQLLVDDVIGQHLDPDSAVSGQPEPEPDSGQILNHMKRFLAHWRWLHHLGELI